MSPIRSSWTGRGPLAPQHAKGEILRPQELKQNNPSCSRGWFLKTYRGDHFSGYKVGDRLVGHRVSGHAVQYSGRLSPDGMEIEGRWWIDPDPESGAIRTEGSFLLRRQAVG